MKRTLLLSLLIGWFLISCSPKDPAPIENVNALHDRFHGKYEPIRSISSEAIDVNLDGKASVDMMVEIPQLDKKYGSHLELRIYGPSKHSSGNSFSFSEYWPEQYIWVNNNRWAGEPISYDPELIVNYLANGIVYTFLFSPNLRRIDLNPSPVEDSFHWPRPQFVIVNADDTIQIVTKRRLYTGMSVKDVVITTVYKRYTMVT